MALNKTMLYLNNQATYRFICWSINPEVNVGIPKTSPTYHIQMVFQLDFSDVRNSRQCFWSSFGVKKSCLVDGLKKKKNELIVWAGLKVEWPAQKHSMGVSDVWQMFITNYNSACTNCQAQTLERFSWKRNKGKCLRLQENKRGNTPTFFNYYNM